MAQTTTSRKRGLHGKNKTERKTKRKRYILHQQHKQSNNNIIINLSSHKLNMAEEKVLNKGLTFVPSIRGPKIQNLNNETERFERALQLNYYFRNNNNNNKKPINKVWQGKSTWLPKKPNPHISRFIINLNCAILDTRKIAIKSNLTREEKQALKDLRNNKDIVIKKADKGGGIAVMDKTEYVTKIDNMLKDENVYEKQNEDNTKQIQDKANGMIHSMLLSRGKINNQQYKYLTSFKAKCPVFYGLPKVHKPDWPLRPIISQIDGPTSKINEIVDTYLDPLLSLIPELLQDTTDFINKLKLFNNINNNTYLITIDVVSLYTNIPQEEGAEWISEFYTQNKQTIHNKYPKLGLISKEELKNLILLILQDNIFKFNNNYFRQKFGTTMGAKFSFKYANIYMHLWYKKHLQNNPNNILTNYFRFVDDLIGSTNKTEQDITNFLQYINTLHNTIKFTGTYSKKSVNFLDTNTYLANNTVLTSLYTKPTDHKQYLHFNSTHPLLTKTSLPYSQYLRIKRIVHEEESLKIETDKMTKCFESRGYPTRVLQKALEKVQTKNRHELLQYNSAQHKENKFQEFLKGKPFLPLILTYQPQYNNYNLLTNILQQHWTHFIQSDPQINKHFGNSFPQLIFKRNTTLTNILVRADLNTKLNQQDSDNLESLIFLINNNPGF